MPAPADIQAATLNKFLAAWREGSAPDTMALWSDDFKQRLLPLSLGESSFRSRDQAALFYPGLVENLRNWELHIKEIVHDSARGTAAVYATSQADTPFSGEKWTNEYAIFLSFSEDGTKVCRLEEMMDSAFYQSFVPKFQRYLMGLGGLKK
ncbi:nuclear transport factor 2 family protein [Aspergillus novofumigatus IBT 16806]|uniref:Monooxygenase nsrS n=1 Tax=Aspergillus novofumigatus (strain IBT 16806) TaxID=1392255 RepID=NSRS_ASPN1|nr:uncharacterized protein P174DRAFT_442171 [Aspergillus novofumigatus IBT 16806]A0A2I1C3Y3.1 RecName: Full=Monooxygenase nsrS; AltName: Full=Neosartorin biosynthesis cluster protein S [Aspergillus novofumigatus IBT 16806]PKX92291.1 hypothetical protein P174DRAFT_442171 [Aspergillus novofumigatus IBT 16806]